MVSRYALDLPVTFRWNDASGRVQSGVGFTRDISAEAMFVITTDAPPHDSEVACEVMLPQFRSATSMQISTHGRVLRMEHGLDLRHRGFAVRGNMLLLCSNAIESVRSVVRETAGSARRSAN